VVEDELAVALDVLVVCIERRQDNLSEGACAPVIAQGTSGANMLFICR
jgi:hypothetical protein